MNDNNPDRAAQIERILATRSPEASATEAVIDLLANLRHWCDHEGQDFAQLDRQAYGHYLAELSDSRKGGMQ